MSPREPLDPPELEGYEYLERLGSGGFSDVFLYERQFPRQKVAIKVLSTDAMGEDARERFTAEANTMASLSTHPYIVTIYQAAISPEGHPYLVMQYYPRPNFNIRARTERFSVAEVLRAGIKVASAVETAHRSDVLHRDIKPANILTSDYGQPGLTDFGIAAAADERQLEAEGMSIPWSPPEVVAGSGLTDERADIYSLAATLYTLLAGRSPFEVPGGSNRSIDLIDRIRRARPAPLERGDVPDSLWRLLLQGMNKDPDGRPATAAEFARSLQVIEVEERFDMTPFEVSDGQEPPPPSEAVDADAGSTRVKGPAVIEAQAPSSSKGRHATSTSHEAFRPAETVARTTKRPEGSLPSASSSRPDLIRHSPYLPAAAAAPPVVPSTAAPAAHQAPTSGTYTAEQPTAVPIRRSGPHPGILIGAAAAGLLLVVAILVGTGAIGGGDDGPTTTVPVLDGPTDVDVNHASTDGGATGDGAFVVTWKEPTWLNQTKGDRVELEVDGEVVDDQFSIGVETYSFQSDKAAPCVRVSTYRDGRQQGNVGASAGCG